MEASGPRLAGSAVTKSGVSLTFAAGFAPRQRVEALVARGEDAHAEDAHAVQPLPVRITYRTMRVLGAIAEVPGSSNRDIADAAGLSDEGQTSKLLGRLEQRGLVHNVGLGQAYGEPNAWLLTGEGERVLGILARCFEPGAGVTRGRRVRGAA